MAGSRVVPTIRVYVFGRRSVLQQNLTFRIFDHDAHNSVDQALFPNLLLARRSNWIVVLIDYLNWHAHSASSTNSPSPRQYTGKSSATASSSDLAFSQSI